MDSWRSQLLPDRPPARQSHQPLNLSLRFGALLTALVILLGILGPQIAPRDPLKENFIVFINDNAFVKPPFPAFAVPGFPLGSDEFGRDVFSRLLWAIRPTLVLVLVVAALRLMFGTGLGLIAGWSKSWFGQAVDASISWALSVPVLFVALFVIAAAGQTLGIWAFILGLALTGWSEVARLVSVETRKIRSQTFIEAATALGASAPQIVMGHILPQIVPLIWVLLAFEISGTLWVTAELGVLGYFINSVWIAVGDWVGIRASGAPELGQMLSNMQRQPWGALAAGGLIFLSILAFNLLGAGLRAYSSADSRRRRGEDAFRSAAGWVEEQIANPLAPLRRQLPTLAAMAVLIILAVGGGLFLWQSQVRQPEAQAMELPGNQLWVTASRDSQGTRFSPFKGPPSARELWKYTYPSGFSGGPVVSSSGTLYLASLDKKIHAIDANGRLLWQADLPNQPVGSPALGVSGKIYIADNRGGLTTVSPQGQITETVPGKSKAPVLSGPVAAADETVYYPTSADLIAVSPTGQIKWQVPLPTYSIISADLRLSPDDRYLIFEDYLIDTRDGSLAAAASPDPLDKILVGTDRRLYRISLSSLTELWVDEKNPAAQKRMVQWDNRTQGGTFRFARDAGVVPSGDIWVAYGSEYDYARLVWLDPNGTFLSTIDYPYRGNLSPLIGIDADNITYVCGRMSVQETETQSSECRANRIGSSAPLWRLSFADPGVPVGGALLGGRIYVATTGGVLLAITNE